jgi:aldose 1-epimerase
MYIIEIVKNQNPLLNQIVIKNEKSNFYSIIYPNLGASLQKLSSNNTEIINGISNAAEGLNDYKNAFKSAFLFPFPNRISDGKYEFGQTKYELDCNEKPLKNALHGHIYDKQFSIKNTETSENNAIVSLYYADEGKTKGFPFPYQIEIIYTFSREKITIDFQVFNNGEKSFPFGIGWHPYFKTSNLNANSLDFEGASQYSLNEKMIPQDEIPLKFKTPLFIEKTTLDDCFITNKPQATFESEAYKIGIDFFPKNKKNYLQVYTPPTRNCIAIEPMTCAPNAFNNKNGLLILEPNKKFEWQISLEYSTVMKL